MGKLPPEAGAVAFALGSLLRERPVAGLLFGLRSHHSIPLLNSADQLILLAGDGFPVIMGEFPPTLAGRPIPPARRGEMCICTGKFCIVLEGGTLYGSEYILGVAKRYAGGIRRGGILLSVHCDSPELRERAKKTLKDTGARGISSASEAAGAIVGCVGAMRDRLWPEASGQPPDGTVHKTRTGAADALENG